MNLALSLAFIAGGGVLIYSGFKNLSIKDTLALINNKRKGIADPGDPATGKTKAKFTNPKTAGSGGGGGGFGAG